MNCVLSDLIFLLSFYFLLLLHTEDFSSSAYEHQYVCPTRSLELQKLLPSKFVLRYVYFTCFMVCLEIIFLMFQSPTSAHFCFYQKNGTFASGI